jgi:hypothetical protein
VKPITRRNLLRALFGSFLGTAGTVVLARATPAAASTEPTPASDVTQRADRLAKALPPSPGDLRRQLFLNGGGPLWRNGGWGNGGGGVWRNGGGGGAWANGGGRGFWRNGGGWPNGFHNGWPNGFFRNW